MELIIFPWSDINLILNGCKTMARFVAEDVTPLSEVFQIDFESGTYGINEKRADGSQVCMVERELPYKPGDVLWLVHTWYFLHITSVRLERLHRIKAEDCVKEGAVVKPHYIRYDGEKCLAIHGRYKKEFIEYWDKNKTGTRHRWDDNPYVWVIEFEQVNYDQSKQILARSEE